ncbi:MAG: hypothetical protein Q9N32_06175 [Gammaproteobacteria bacterium]|nr:hypothetical protein [Gammaproteobacteria bacterium]
MFSLYPEIEPYQTHQISMEEMDNGQQHQIYIEECGKPERASNCFSTYGGPGSGCRSQHRRYFDPDTYRRIFYLDQRGCGRSSLPHGELGK